jgi:hypothetical protein
LSPCFMDGLPRRFAASCRSGLGLNPVWETGVPAGRDCRACVIPAHSEVTPAHVLCSVPRKRRCRSSSCDLSPGPRIKEIWRIGSPGRAKRNPAKLPRIFATAARSLDSGYGARNCAAPAPTGNRPRRYEPAGKSSKVKQVLRGRRAGVICVVWHSSPLRC